MQAWITPWGMSSWVLFTDDRVIIHLDVTWATQIVHKQTQ